MNQIHTPMLPIHITPHHFRLSPALCEFVHEKLAKVPRFASDLLAADVVLRRHHGTANGKQFSASARLALAGCDIHATAAHADLYTAIGKLVARLARRARKRKTRLAKTHTTPRSLSSGKPHPIAEPPPHQRSGALDRAVFGDPRAIAMDLHRG